MAVVGAQYFVATRVKHGLRLEVLQQAVFICRPMTAIPLISPPFAARLPAKLLQERDFHGNACERLISSSEAVVKDWEGIARVAQNLPVATWSTWRRWMATRPKSRSRAQDDYLMSATSH